MLTPIYKKKFLKDLERAEKRGKNLDKIKTIISDIVNEKTLNKQLLDHPLKAEYQDCRECHIEPDWLLVYLPERKFVTFVRTGTHSDLFK